MSSNFQLSDLTLSLTKGAGQGGLEGGVIEEEEE